jgi:hypothetical protein
VAAWRGLSGKIDCPAKNMTMTRSTRLSFQDSNPHMVATIDIASWCALLRRGREGVCTERKRLRPPRFSSATLCARWRSSDRLSAFFQLYDAAWRKKRLRSAAEEGPAADDHGRQHQVVLCRPEDALEQIPWWPAATIWLAPTCRRPDLEAASLTEARGHCGTIRNGCDCRAHAAVPSCYLSSGCQFNRGSLSHGSTAPRTMVPNSLSRRLTAA